MFKSLPIILLILIVSCSGPGKKENTQSPEAADIQETPGVYELRTYYAAEGKLDALLTRFRDHTTTLFEKHGMTNVGYWTPIENDENTLIYLLQHDSRKARDQSFESFRADPAWIDAKTKSEENGKLVDSIQNVFLIPTSYSPELVLADQGPRVFELRTYYTNEGKLNNLHARFENHTMKIFENNNMTNIVYFDLDADQGDNTLVYFITHADTANARTNWENFINDPEWKAAYEASIVDGSLVKTLTSQYLESKDFSPLK